MAWYWWLLISPFILVSIPILIIFIQFVILGVCEGLYMFWRLITGQWFL